MPRKRSQRNFHRRAVLAGNPAGGRLSQEDLQQPVRPQHAVYYITDNDETWLYVGYTSQLVSRLRLHANKSAWFHPGCDIYTEWFDSRELARQREAHAIAEFDPAHNIDRPVPYGGSPEPSIPMTLLTSMQDHVGPRCTNCLDKPVANSTNGLCQPCYSWLHKHGDVPAYQEPTLR